MAAPNSLPEIDISLYNTVTEGKGTILFPKNNEVFYNPVQQFNRDMSIAAIRTWSEIYAQEKKDRIDRKLQRKDPEEREKSKEELTKYIDSESFTVLEALAASGLRSIRYAKELPNLKYVVANDLIPEAVESIRRNVKYNQISEDLVRPNLGDAKRVMYNAIDEQIYNVVDLDPYGSAAPFIDGAVQAVTDGGLLCVTCTDLAILTGSMHPETCFGKYGGMPLKGTFPHEMALRLVLQMIQTSAGRYQRHIVPLMSCSIDFYLRVFVRVYKSPAKVKEVATKTAMVYECSGCHAYAVQPIGKVIDKDNGLKHHMPAAGPPVNTNCTECGGIHHIGGPIWSAPLHDKAFVNKVLQHVRENKDNYGTSKRMEGMLAVISEELDDPLYWTMKGLCGTVHCTSISIPKLYSAILNAGYKVSGSHCGPQAIKTNAPASVMWDIFKGWIKLNPITMKNIKENSPAQKILSKEPSMTPDFTHHPEAEPQSRKFKLVRHQMNPTPNWGPMARAGKKRKADADPIKMEE